MDPVSMTDDPMDPRDPRNRDWGRDTGAGFEPGPGPGAGFGPPPEEFSRRPEEQGGRAAGAREALSRAHLPRPAVRRTPAPSASGGGGRRIQVAVGVVVALCVGVGYGYSVKPAAAAPQTGAASKSTAVRTATLVCPEVVGVSDASVNAITPVTATGDKPGTGDTAVLTALGAKKPLATLKQTGTLSANRGLSGDTADLNQDSIPVAGQATGAFAPGFTLTETLSNGAGDATHGIASTPCTAPDTDFWYLGADPGKKGVSKLALSNTDQLTAQLNVTAYTTQGVVTGNAAQTGTALLVPAGGQHDPLDLSSFSGSGDPIAVHLATTAGRVTSALLDSDAGSGRDFIQAQKPQAHMMLPGVPALTGKGTAMKLELVMFAPNSDTDVTLHWLGANKISPTVVMPHLAAGKVEQVDISSIPAPGEAGALQIDSSSGVPFLAEIRVSGIGGLDTAFLGPVQPLAGESVVADNGSGSTVQLTNNGTKDAQVRVTVEGSGTPASQTVTVPASSTKAVALQAPKNAATYAVSVTPLDGANQVYAARVMTQNGGLLTIQPMSTALETVQIPPVRSDLSGIVPQP